MIVRRHGAVFYATESEVGLEEDDALAMMLRVRSNLRMVLTCHFKQLGLKEGEPAISPSGVVKTYKAC